MVMAQCDTWVENEEYEDLAYETSPASTATIVAMKPYGEGSTTTLSMAAEQAEEDGRE